MSEGAQTSTEIEKRNNELGGENLGLLIRNRVISYPRYPDPLAELDVFKSGFTFSGAPDYATQTAQQSGIQALCLVTYDVPPEPFVDVYYSYEGFL